MNFRYNQTGNPSADSNFEQLRQLSLNLHEIVRDFCDATSASLSRSLPDGSIHSTRDYFFIKIDGTANTVTISAFGSQTINGSSTVTLSSQYDKALIVWDSNSQNWYLV